MPRIAFRPAPDRPVATGRSGRQCTRAADRTTVLDFEPGRHGAFERLAIEAEAGRGFIVVVNGVDVEAFLRVEDALARLRRIERGLGLAPAATEARAHRAVTVDVGIRGAVEAAP